MKRGLILSLLFILLTSLSASQQHSMIPPRPLTLPDKEAVASVNVPVPLELLPFWESAEVQQYSTGLMWDDCNRDGWIDAFVSNGNDIVLASNMLYRSVRGVMPAVHTWASSNAHYSGHCAVGDIDKNGYPDFIVANYLGDGRFGTDNKINLYYNTLGQLSVSPDWYSTDSMNSFSCALGDVDNDGDLDLAVATGDGYEPVFTPDRIYENVNGSFSGLPIWESSVNTAAMDVTWGDVDNDGDLDLALCTDQEGALLYLNNSGVMNTSPSWQSSDAEPANTIIFADADGNGWQDLIVAFNNQLGSGGYYRLYLNNGAGVLSSTPDWESATGGYGSAVSVYDYDQDGDMDLAAGRWWDQPRVYENLGDTFTSSPIWQSDWATVVEELAWVDIDADGVEIYADTITPSGSKKLYYVSQMPLYSLDSVFVNGVKLTIDGYCYDLRDGWISLSTVPSGIIEVFYQYSHKNDLTLSNWDTFNLAYGNTNEPYVKMYAEPADGWAPLTVQFSDSSSGATDWLWYFSDGTTSTEQNPQHEFTTAGFFDVMLNTTLPDRVHIRKVPQMIALFADTLYGSDVETPGGVPVVIPVYATNYYPLSQIDIPIEYGGTLPMQFDSVSIVGCRTEYFDEKLLSHVDLFNRRAQVKLKAGTEQELPAGSGLVAKVYLHLLASAQPGQITEVLFDGYDERLPYFWGSQINFEPKVRSGIVTYSSNCCAGIRGNVDGDIDDVCDVSDLLYLVDYMFLQPPGPAPPCPDEADVDGVDGIDVSDLLYLVDYMFLVPPGPAPVSCN